MNCIHHNVEMVVGEGKLICPEAGCPQHAQLPPLAKTKEETDAQAAREKEASEKQATMEADVKALHAQNKSGGDK